MTALREALLGLVRGRNGEENALPVAEAVQLLVAQGFKVDDREARKAAQELVLTDGKMIASSEKGFFRPKDMAEAEVCAKRMQDTGNMWIMRANRLRVAATDAFSPTASMPLAKAVGVTNDR